jgi:FtsH-binding integral membrane protein
MARTADDLIAKFHHRTAYHLGHMLVFIGVPCMILNFIYTRDLLQGAGKVYGSVGAVIAILGSVILAGDKGALCIVLSAFDTLPQSDFESIRPAIQTIVERRGLLTVFWALPLLPLGAIIQMIGMVKERVMPRVTGAAAIVGLVLLNNPDIDLLSSCATLLMCTAYIPFGVRTLVATEAVLDSAAKSKLDTAVTNHSLAASMNGG